MFQNVIKLLLTWWNVELSPSELLSKGGKFCVNCAKNYLIQIFLYYFIVLLFVVPGEPIGYHK